MGRYCSVLRKGTSQQSNSGLPLGPQLVLVQNGPVLDFTWSQFPDGPFDLSWALQKWNGLSWVNVDGGTQYGVGSSGGPVSATHDGAGLYGLLATVDPDPTIYYSNEVNIS